MFAKHFDPNSRPVDRYHGRIYMQFQLSEPGVLVNGYVITRVPSKGGPIVQIAMQPKIGIVTRAISNNSLITVEIKFTICSVDVRNKVIVVFDDIMQTKSNFTKRSCMSFDSL